MMATESDYNWETGKYKSGSFEAAMSNQGLNADGSEAGTNEDSESEGEPKGKNKNNSNERKTINKKGEVLVGNIKPEEVNILNTVSNEFTPENNTVIWVSHGSNNGINGHMNAYAFHEHLMATSPLYKSSYENGKPVTIKLFSCNTGHNTPDGLAFNLSLIHTKATIWAPDNLISWPSDNGILFPNYEPYIGVDGKKSGQFNIFNNGSVVGTGDFKN
ncbi:hypothetical protein J2X31_003713 [Flavobacterium arsenatis]|uniref:Peptidase C80 domain-containing protein n=1 Tax=Flavobacterium arsenatis TaxID=1484332 RepID=A0ABU1TUX1_9FLAO|nr:hypothetical protein [Flavobacterium arsenatis]MDR6969679.1 hypothetical protein [Flavobacterium arsenatis]